MTYDRWKTRSPDDDLSDMGPPSREQEEADYWDEQQRASHLPRDTSQLSRLMDEPVELPCNCNGLNAGTPLAIHRRNGE